MKNISGKDVAFDYLLQLEEQRQRRRSRRRNRNIEMSDKNYIITTNQNNISYLTLCT